MRSCPMLSLGLRLLVAAVAVLALAPPGQAGWRRGPVPRVLAAGFLKGHCDSRPRPFHRPAAAPAHRLPPAAAPRFVPPAACPGGVCPPASPPAFLAPAPCVGGVCPPGR